MMKNIGKFKVVQSVQHHCMPRPNFSLLDADVASEPEIGICNICAEMATKDSTCIN